MIAKLTCDQVADIWPTIREGLQKDLHFPITGKNKYRESYILEALLTGAMEAWVSYTKTEEEQKIHLHLITLTAIFTNGCTKNKDLFMFSIIGFRPPSARTWAELKQTLFKYARGKGCHTITGASNDEGILAVARRMGADTSFSFISFDLEEK